MSNQKGNIFPLWGVSNDYEVFAIDSQQQLHSKSEVNFASRLAVSEDGTIWALSLEPDPDGGGAKLYWSNGNGQWTEINTSDPGGVQISGYVGSQCLYLDWDSNLRSLNTDGSTTLLSRVPDNMIVDFDYGGGQLWALIPKEAGGIPILQHTDMGQPLSFKAFPSDVYPYGLSVSYQGNCYAIAAGNPMYYGKDGTSGSAGSGVNGESMIISFKNWAYVLSLDANEKGNLLYIWEDIAGGTFKATSIRLSSIAASYYSGAH